MSDLLIDWLTDQLISKWLIERSIDWLYYTNLCFGVFSNCYRYEN